MNLDHYFQILLTVFGLAQTLHFYILYGINSRLERMENLITKHLEDHATGKFFAPREVVNTYH